MIDARRPGMIDAVRIAIPIFDRLTALDAVGPYEVLSRLPGATVHFVAAEPGPKQTENGMLAISADLALDDLTEPDVIVVPGGFGNRPLLKDESMLAWLRHAHEHSQWTTSVCTGSLLLGAAGILTGLEATTHWLSLELLREYGATPVSRRVVEQGKVITAAGVSAGIDMALTLAARLAGEDEAKGIQLGIEYDPDPPFASGSPATASPEIVALVRANRERLG
jgi:transcriptional regulator GlxA family with amidase domain